MDIDNRWSCVRKTGLLFKVVIQVGHKLF